MIKRAVLLPWWQANERYTWFRRQIVVLPNIIMTPSNCTSEITKKNFNTNLLKEFVPCLMTGQEKSVILTTVKILNSTTEITHVVFKVWYPFRLSGMVILFLHHGKAKWPPQISRNPTPNLCGRSLISISLLCSLSQSIDLWLFWKQKNVCVQSFWFRLHSERVPLKFKWSSSWLWFCFQSMDVLPLF